jgi:hypothetical protein
MFIYYIGRSMQLVAMWVLLVAVFTAGPWGPSPRLFGYGIAIFVAGWGIVRYTGRAKP